MQKKTMLITMIQAARILDSKKPVQTAATTPMTTKGEFAADASRGLNPLNNSRNCHS
jgi:hypothetical protein